MIKTISKAAAYWQMRSLEISLQDALDTLQFVRDTDTLAGMHLSIKVMRAELSRARAHYQSFLPPGRRMTFRVA